MADVIQKLQFKRGTKTNLENLLVAGKKGIPAAGEPVYELPEESGKSGKIKIGDGIHSYAELPYYEAGTVVEGAIVLKGYYESSTDIFWKEQSKINPLPRLNTKIYKNITDGLFYYLDNNVYTLVFDVANADKYGLVKLYSTNGQNTDGAMTQKAVTDSISVIKFEVEVDSTDNENCLNLKKPW